MIRRTAKQMERGRRAKRELALFVRDPEPNPVPRRSAAGPFSPPIKLLDPDTRALIDAALNRSPAT